MSFPVKTAMPKSARCSGSAETVQAHDLWIQDAISVPVPSCARSTTRDAGFITRQHEGLPFEAVTTFARGSHRAGQVAEQRVQVWDAQGQAHPFRRIRVKLDQANARW